MVRQAMLGDAAIFFLRGALLHDAVSIWAPIYPFLNFELMLKAPDML